MLPAAADLQGGQSQTSLPTPKPQHSICSFSCLPAHVQSLIFAYSGAPLDTCKASCAVVLDTYLLSEWLKVARSTPFLTACLHSLWGAALHLLDTSDHRATEPQLQVALRIAAEHGQTQLLTALLKLVRPAPHPCNFSHFTRATLLTQARQRPGSDLMNMLGFKHPLSCAASKGHVEACRVLLAAGTASAGAARLAVSEAAKAGHLAVVQLIMEKSGMPEVSKPDLGQNPLSSAVEGGHVDIVRYLLQQGLNPTNQKGTPWSYVHGAAPHASAAASGSCELLQLLIEADSRGWQPLHWRDALNKAAAAGHLQSVQLLVSHMPADVWHQLQVLSNHPLSNAAGGGKIEVVQLLIDVAPQGGQTTYWVDAIASAAGGGHLQVVQLLMSRLPVSVHQQPVSERSLPLVSAADGGHADIVQLLLDQGWFDEEGLKEALCFAACRGAVHIMQMLSDKGAVVDSESKGFDPVSPLGAAIRSEQPAAVEWLLSKGASCDKLALVYAVRHSNTPTRSPVMCQALLQGGVQDSNAHALFEAARCGYREVVQLLLSPGSGAPQTEEEQLFRWEVALCGAASMGRVEVVKYLLQAAPATPAPSAAQPPSAASSSASAAPRAAAPAAARNSAAAAPGTVAGAPAGAGSPPPEILECLTKAVEAAVIGGRYTVPANSRCRWVTGEEDFDEEAAFEAEWLWQLAREKSYPMAYGAQGSSEVTRLLVAAGADPDHEKGRVIKTAIRWSAESEAGLLVLDALVDVRRDAKVITSGEACWCAIDSHQYDACCVLLPVTPPGTVDEMELGRLQHMAKSRRDTEMLQLINYHLQAIF